MQSLCFAYALHSNYMQPQQRQRIKSLLHKAKVVKGRRLTKPERSQVVDGVLALDKLGIYDKPN